MECTQKCILEQFASEFLKSRIAGNVTNEQEEFVKYMFEGLTNMNEIYLRDIALRQCVGLQMLKKGLRRNNYVYVEGGKQLINELLFVGQHHIYRKIMARMSLSQILATDEFRFLIDSNVGIAISSDNSSGEGIDFKVILNMDSSNQ